MSDKANFEEAARDEKQFMRVFLTRVRGLWKNEETKVPFSLSQTSPQPSQLVLTFSRKTLPK